MAHRPILALLVFLLGAHLAPIAAVAQSNRLAIRDHNFTLNGQPVFLLGLSYYGGLGASEETVRADLQDAQKLGFNWLRVWATWNALGHDLSAVDTNGVARPPWLMRLQWLVSECDRRGVVVDVTLTRGPLLPSFLAHRRAVETIIEALKFHNNWFIDLANEHDIKDARFASDDELRQLRELIRQYDPQRLVTASFGGHDLTRAEVKTALLTIGLDFLAPHRPRNRKSPAETESQTRELRAVIDSLGCSAPILYQEPFRRGYSDWEPQPDDYLNDLRGARAGGAAGWCLHNGQQADTPNHEPRRSFDLSQHRLFEQLDSLEREAAQRIALQLRQ